MIRTTKHRVPKVTTGYTACFARLLFVPSPLGSGATATIQRRGSTNYRITSKRHLCHGRNGERVRI